MLFRSVSQSRYKALEAQARSLEQQAGRLRGAMSEASQVISGAGSDGSVKRGERISGKYFNIYLHRVVMNVDESVLVDHIDHNKLNCQKNNLRAATKKLNAQNRLPMRGKVSSYKGVSIERCSGKWVATIKVGDKQRKLGRFSTELQAAQAYDKAAETFYGEFS